MHLKRLQLIGFKTFAERTQIEFSPGVTAIVGPNGSGKSNIADAILWVLGEQRASAVRGAKLQDVIFSGSALRKPTGLAEVSLTVDNSDGSLPLAYEEVTVTRRAYRSGEGEFSINKTPCRLRDIQELFLDTGVGRESYALVNQSEIDAVLSADPQARRPLFEEAAGIHKFRVKKREALRRLEQTETNLVRVRDIVREIERRLSPLERQAEEAIRYLAVKQKLESLERDYLVSELITAERDLCAAKAERAAGVERSERALLGLSRAEERVGSLSEALAEAERALDSARAAQQTARSLEERARSEQELAGQRAQGIAAQAEMIRAEIDDLEARGAAALATAESVGGQAGAEHEREVQLRARAELLDAQRTELLPKIAAMRRTEEARLLRAAERDRARAVRDAELATLRARSVQAAARERELEVAALETERQAGAAESERASCEKARERTADRLKAASERLATEERSVEIGRNRLSEAQAAAAKMQAAAATERSRLQTLQELESAHEGYYSGVRAVLRAAETGRLGGQYTVVADAFRAPDGLDIALEIALGASLQDVIVGTEREAKDAIELLKADRAGRATFLPIARIRSGGPRPRLSGPIAGFLGCAADLVTFESRHSPVIEMLLGRTLVCETIEDALLLSDQASGWGKIVTRAGELLLPSGAIAGGSSAKSSGALLHRKTEIAGLSAQAARSEAQLEEQLEQVDRLRTALDDAIASSSRLAQERAQAQQALSDTERALDRAVRDSQRLGQSRSTAAAQLAGVRNERAAAQSALSVREAEDAQARSEIAAGDGGDGADTSLLPALIDRERAVHDELTQARIALAALQQKLRGDDNIVQTARLDSERIALQKSRRRERLDGLEAEATMFAERESDLAAALIAAQAQVLALQSEVDACVARRAELAAELREAQTNARSFAADRADSVAAVQAADLRDARLQMQQSQTAARLLEEYDVTVADALAHEHPPAVAAETPREVGRLRREMRGFGEVNAHAATEYTQLKLRYESTLAQQQDAEAAKDKVLAAIREIDDSTRGLFMESFHRVGQAFEEIFQRLMGGGRTELSLTDPDNLLETGIDIAVQAPGKKKQSLLLLSGGERALTAAALLFGFLQVRPAPFCVLDEVDAPLDGVNVERFANLLKDFGKTGQFLIITHNPSTMEAAGCWYGVTMQEPGVSRVLSMEAPAQADATRATMEPMMPSTSPTVQTGLEQASAFH